jgi:hypothetical protein
VDWTPLAASSDVGNFGKSLRDSIDGTPRRRPGAAAAPAGSALPDDERSRIDRDLRDRLRALGYIH